jgi:hypothetical protein
MPTLIHEADRSCRLDLNQSVAMDRNLFTLQCTLIVGTSRTPRPPGRVDSMLINDSPGSHGVFAAAHWFEREAPEKIR